jgi:hypothetical protein
MERPMKDGPLQPSSSKARKLFREKWEFLTPQTDYLRPLSDFLVAPAPPQTEPTIPQTAQEKFEEYEAQLGQAPLLLYSARVTPYAGEEN